TLPPASALHAAAIVIACAPAAVVVATTFLVHENKSQLDLAALRHTTRGLMSAIKSRTLWIVAGFLAFWNFTPSFGTPLFYHMVDHLNFEQYFIGQLTAIASVGAVIGAFVYRRYLADRYPSKTLVYLSIVLGSGTTLAYLLPVNKTSAAMLHFKTGILRMIPMVTLVRLSAECSP